jgi:hypothetical protein
MRRTAAFLCSKAERSELMTESLNRQSAEIIPFPGRHRAPVYGIDTRALEAEAAKYRSAIDTTGWYHEEAIEDEHDHTCHKYWQF